MSKKILNILPIIIASILFIVSLCLGNGMATGAFLFCGIMWIEAKLALRKTKSANPLKAWFRSREKSETLRIIYMCLYGFFFIIGAYCFITGFF